MTQRISYTKADETGLRRSRETFATSDGTEVYVVINTNENTFVIKNDDTILTEGTAVSYQMLLKAAKAGLITLGVALSTEKRNRGENGATGQVFENAAQAEVNQIQA